MLLVMEYVENGCLMNYLRERLNKIDPKTMLRFAREVAQVRRHKLKYSAPNYIRPLLGRCYVAYGYSMTNDQAGGKMSNFLPIVYNVTVFVV